MACINEIKLSNVAKLKGKDGNMIFSDNIKSGTSVIGTFSESEWDMPPKIEVLDKGVQHDLENLSKRYFEKYPPVYAGVTGIEAMVSDLMVFDVIQNRIKSMPDMGALAVFTGKSVELFVVEKSVTQREIEMIVIAQTDNPKTKVRYFLFLSDDDFNLTV